MSLEAPIQGIWIIKSTLLLVLSDFCRFRDAAVDDILFENGPCPTEGSCDFENDYCGYLNTKEGDDFDWERGKGRVYYFTGPGVDHTTSTVEGYYIFINPSSSMPMGTVYFLNVMLYTRY